ncbi:MAG: hypothetical protein A2Y25_02205 [Candidatus Melainabacteria bacterium GWF2_37_15]|nr:MAG: hypothetical protein A2Y25_02205 [Candidatus Melainabacteria bacterium GWF2_37_15]
MGNEFNIMNDYLRYFPQYLKYPNTGTLYDESRDGWNGQTIESAEEYLNIYNSGNIGNIYYSNIQYADLNTDGSINIESGMNFFNATMPLDDQDNDGKITAIDRGSFFMQDYDLDENGELNSEEYLAGTMVKDINKDGVLAYEERMVEPYHDSVYEPNLPAMPSINYDKITDSNAFLDLTNNFYTYDTDSNGILNADELQKAKEISEYNDQIDKTIAILNELSSANPELGQDALFGLTADDTTNIAGFILRTGVTLEDMRKPPVEPPIDPPVEPPVEPPVNPPVQPPVEPPVQPPVEPPVNPFLNIDFSLLCKNAGYNNTLLGLNKETGEVQTLIASSKNYGIGQEGEINLGINDLEDLDLLLLPNAWGNCTIRNKITQAQAGNGELVYRDDKLYFISNSGEEILLNTPIFHSDGISADGIDHANTVESENAWTINFEDLWGGGDNDYDDLVIKMIYN